MSEEIFPSSCQCALTIFGTLVLGQANITRTGESWQESGNLRNCSRQRDWLNVKMVAEALGSLKKYLQFSSAELAMMDYSNYNQLIPGKALLLGSALATWLFLAN